MRKWASLALLTGGVAALAAAVLYTLGVSGPIAKSPNPLYSTPRGTLEAYIAAVLDVDEDRELDTATPKARVRAERQRGPDKALRKEKLAGKAKLFRDVPIEFVKEKTWGDYGEALVKQGGQPEAPAYYVYTFRLIDGEWKIEDIETGRNMRW